MSIYANSNRNYVQTRKHVEENLSNYVREKGPKKTTIKSDSTINPDVFRLAVQEMEDEKLIKILQEKDGKFEIDFTALFMRRHNF